MTMYLVRGMDCGHCREAVRRAVTTLPGVTGAVVDLDGGTVSVQGMAEASTVCDAIREAGYEAEPA